MSEKDSDEEWRRDVARRQREANERMALLFGKAPSDFEPRASAAEKVTWPLKSRNSEFVRSLIEKYASMARVMNDDVPALVAEGSYLQAVELQASSTNEVSQLVDLMVGVFNLIRVSLPLLQALAPAGSPIHALSITYPPIAKMTSDDDGGAWAMRDEWVWRAFERDVLAGPSGPESDDGDAGVLPIRRNDHPRSVSGRANEIAYILSVLGAVVEPGYAPADWREIETSKEAQPRYIAKEVKIAVWRRDSGRCVNCNSQERLEYDHIIPVTKGGSSTERNIQLLCERCNRQKAASIS